MNKGRLAHFIGLLGRAPPNFFEMRRVASRRFAVALRRRGFSLKL